MKGQHRFLHVHNGITSFAHVEVLAAEGTGEGPAVVEDLPEHPRADEAEVNRRTAGSWVDAACDGIHQAVAVAESRGIPLHGWQFRLTRLLGTPVDTRADAVRCAALLATLAALGPPATLPAGKVVFDGRWWSVHFPFAVADAVQGTAK